MEFVDSVPKSTRNVQRPSRWDADVEMLRSRKGEWAKMASFDKEGTASGVYRTLKSRYPDLEVTTRRAEGKTDVYARSV